MRIAPAILFVILLVSGPWLPSHSASRCARTSQNNAAAPAQLSSTAKDEFAAGDRAFNARDYQQAQRHFERVTQLAPQWPRGWKALGVTLAFQNNIVAAESPLRKACELSPREPDACYYLARGLYASDRFVAALKVLTSLLTTDPQPARIEEAIAHAKEGLGEFDDAEKWYRKGVARDARRCSLAFGRFLLRQGRLDEGVPWLKRAVQYEPDSGSAHLALGQAYLEAGSADQADLADRAVNELREAVRLLPQDEAARHLLQKAQSQRAASRG